MGYEGQRRQRWSIGLVGRLKAECGRNLINKGPDGWPTGPMKRNEILTYNFHISKLSRFVQQEYLESS